MRVRRVKGARQELHMRPKALCQSPMVRFGKLRLVHSGKLQRNQKGALVRSAHTGQLFGLLIPTPILGVYSGHVELEYNQGDVRVVNHPCPISPVSSFRFVLWLPAPPPMYWMY